MSRVVPSAARGSDLTIVPLCLTIMLALGASRRSKDSSRLRRTLSLAAGIASLQGAQRAAGERRTPQRVRAEMSTRGPSYPSLLHCSRCAARLQRTEANVEQ